MLTLVGAPQMLGFINARLVLRTGITLDQNGPVPPQDVAKVVAALKEMGFAVDGQGERA
jgi:hypothetical protein